MPPPAHAGRNSEQAFHIHLLLSLVVLKTFIILSLTHLPSSLKSCHEIVSVSDVLSLHGPALTGFAEKRGAVLTGEAHVAGGWSVPSRSGSRLRLW